MSEELTDLVRKIGIESERFVGFNKLGKKLKIAPYDISHADFFTHVYSEDNKDHLGYFVTKGWSPSIKSMQEKHGTEYKESEEYKESRDQRHQNTIQRNSKDRYFFTILEDNKPIGYVSVVEKEEEDHKFGRVSVMIGFRGDCGNESGTLALKSMLQVLAEKTGLEFYDGKVEEDNNPSLRMMRKVFGEDVEVTKEFENVYSTLDEKSETKTAQRQYFKRSADFLLPNFRINRD